MKDAPDARAAELRRDRVRLCFGERRPGTKRSVLERYELLYEAGLVRGIRARQRQPRESAGRWARR